MLNALRQFISPPGNRRDDLGLLYSSQQFRRILDRERALADRNHHYFCVLAFSVEFRQQHPRLARRLAAALGRQIRLSDELGWFGPDEIGVVLPQTPPAGAVQLAERVKDSLEPKGGQPEIEYTVYVYPSDESGRRTSAEMRRHHAESAERSAEEGAVAEGAAEEEAGQAASYADQKRALQPHLAPGLPGWKRLLDLTGAGMGLIVASPIFLAISLLIKVTSPGPVLFRQERVGYRGRNFVLWKFRTMHLDSDEGLHRDHLKELMDDDRALTKLDSGRDPRVIRGGNLLRATGLDELPQLINVLRGDMSLVGPRPCIPYEAQNYAQWQTRRFDTLPGLTGLWQVKGKNRTTFREMIRLDISYLRRRTLWTDLWISLKTIPAIVEQQRAKKADAGKASAAPSSGESKQPAVKVSSGTLSSDNA